MNGIAVVFTSVLSSGVVAAAISASFSEATERWCLRRSKIEEIYLSGAAWLTFANARFLPYLRVCNGSLTYSQVLDLDIKNADQAIGDHHLKMKMNIEMYERSLVPALRLMEQELEKLNKVHSELRNRYDQTGPASEFGVPLRGPTSGIRNSR